MSCQVLITPSLCPKPPPSICLSSTGQTLCLPQAPAHQSRLEASPRDSDLDFLLVNLLIRLSAYSPRSPANHLGSDLVVTQNSGRILQIPKMQSHLGAKFLLFLWPWPPRSWPSCLPHLGSSFLQCWGFPCLCGPSLSGPHMLPFPFLSTLIVTSSLPSIVKTLFS